MMAKCLIIGHAPTEMVDLFGYNPVLEIDTEEPCRQLSNVICRYDDFIPLIERNYQEVLKNHTWDRRWAEISRLLSETNSGKPRITRKFSQRITERARMTPRVVHSSQSDYHNLPHRW
jgi:hypothetical protein